MLESKYGTTVNPPHIRSLLCHPNLRTQQHAGI